MKNAGGQTVVHNKLPQPRHDNNHSTCNKASKSWRSDVPIILPGWAHHTGGSRSKPTVHPVPGTPGRLWVPQQHATDAQMSPTHRHGSGGHGCESSTIPQNLFTRRAKMRQCVPQSFPTRISGRSPCKEVQIQSPTE